MTKTMHVDLKAGDHVIVGNAKIRLEKKSGQVARLVIEADDTTVIQNPTAARRSALQTSLEQSHGKHPV